MQTYLGWSDFDDEPGKPAGESSEPTTGWEAIDRLLKERAGVEQHLLRLLGKAPPQPADAREQARFPMPVYTAESRMADRRAAREEERARAAARRASERVRLLERDLHERIDLKRRAEAAALAAAAQRDANERRASERQQDRARALLVDALIRAAWEAQRIAALEASRQARRREWSQFADRYERSHDRARRLRVERRAADKALAERLDSRSPRARDDFDDLVNRSRPQRRAR